MQVR